MFQLFYEELHVDVLFKVLNGKKWSVMLKKSRLCEKT